MTKFKKMISVLMSVAMIVCMFAVPAGAASVFDNAIKISAMETCSKEFKEDYQTIYYKLVLNDSGTLIFRCRDSRATKFELYNSNAETIISGNGLAKINSWDDPLDGKKIKIEKKGTYYLGITSKSSGSKFSDLYYTFKPNNTPAISICLTIRVGETLDLSAVTNNYKGNVTWKTTKSSVATVSKGTVTAKKKGTAQIRAYMNNGDYAEITVKVTK